MPGLAQLASCRQTSGLNNNRIHCLGTQKQAMKGRVAAEEAVGAAEDAAMEAPAAVSNTVCNAWDSAKGAITPASRSVRRAARRTRVRTASAVRHCNLLHVLYLVINVASDQVKSAIYVETFGYNLRCAVLYSVFHCQKLAGWLIAKLLLDPRSGSQ